MLLQTLKFRATLFTRILSGCENWVVPNIKSVYLQTCLSYSPCLPSCCINLPERIRHRVQPLHSLFRWKPNFKITLARICLKNSSLCWLPKSELEMPEFPKFNLLCSCSKLEMSSVPSDAIRCYSDRRNPMRNRKDRAHDTAVSTKISPQQTAPFTAVARTFELQVIHSSSYQSVDHSAEVKSLPFDSNSLLRCFYLLLHFCSF